MRKTTMATMLTMDGDSLLARLQEASRILVGSDGEFVLDFSSVHRIDFAAIREMENLAAIADKQALRVALRGVNVDIYKVLKLVKLAPRFSLLT